MSSSISAATFTVRLALNTTRRVMFCLLDKVLHRCLDCKNVDSVFKQFRYSGYLYTALMQAEWKEVQHDIHIPEFHTFVSHIGNVGIIEIANQPDDATFVVNDPKETGKAELIGHVVMGPILPETILFLGTEEGYQIVVAVRQNEHVRPSIVMTNKLPHGTFVSKAKALKMGFKYAKVLS